MIIIEQLFIYGLFGAMLIGCFYYMTPFGDWLKQITSRNKGNTNETSGHGDKQE